MKLPYRLLWCTFLALLCVQIQAQVDASVNSSKPTVHADISATGTGRTTGHIADLKIKNTADTPIKIAPQTVYIPSGGQYQPYVAKIPGTTVPPHETVIIPVPGYCADVRKPPVGAGDGMPPIDTWITTTPAPTPKPTGTDYPVVTNVVPPFTPQHIPEIITTPGFTPNPPPKTTPVPTDIITTWPGTAIPVNGTIDPAGYPETFAPVIIDALEKITVAFDKLKGEGTVKTPFSGDPVKERESVIQQTFWIFTADITGEKYKKESFQEKVIEQFENSTGTTVATLPEAEKKKLDGGVDAFWNVFVATGVEAKVISEKNVPPSENPPIFISEEVDKVEIPDDCGSIKGKITTNPEKYFKKLNKLVVYVTSSCEFCPPIPPYEQVIIKEDMSGMHPHFVIVPQDSSVTIMNTHEKEIDIAPRIDPSPIDGTRTHSIPTVEHGKSAVITPKRTAVEANKGNGFYISNDIRAYSDALMLVTPNRCYAIADKEGNYTIGKLPPGGYNLKVYLNPKILGFAEGSVMVESGKISIKDFVLERSGDTKEAAITGKKEQKETKQGSE